jgi:hypothetical protein
LTTICITDNNLHHWQQIASLTTICITDNKLHHWQQAASLTTSCITNNSLLNSIWRLCLKYTKDLPLSDTQAGRMIIWSPYNIFVHTILCC